MRVRVRERERENESCSDERYDFEMHTLGRIMFLLPVDGGILSRWKEHCCYFPTTSIPGSRLNTC